jgi:hypothetical protein
VGLDIWTTSRVVRRHGEAVVGPERTVGSGAPA